MRYLILCALLVVTGQHVVAQHQTLSKQEEIYLSNASKESINGWIWIKVRGTSYERGFQYGYLSAQEYREAVRVYAAMTYQTTGMTLDFFEQKGAQMHEALIPSELLEELQGLADGYTRAGVPMTLATIIGWNAYLEISGYWWPTVANQYGAVPPNVAGAKGRCSAFIATGNATRDQKIAIGHETFAPFWMGQHMNIILDITPESGARMVMQTSPGWIASMTDFWVTGHGLVIVETTLAGFVGAYNTTKIPEYVRARMASQYGTSIEHWVDIMNDGNNGGYANSWLIGDINTNEIARFEQGVRYTNLEKKTNGTFFGSNVAFDPRIRNLECTDVGYDDIRQQTGARRTRWPQLLSQYDGEIDANVSKIMLADTYDVWLQRNQASSRTICAHYDIDPQTSVSDPNAIWNVPYWPAGSVDAKVTTADLAKNLSLWGIFGRADGVLFNASAFLSENPQWNWQEGYLMSRLSRPWTLF